MTETPQFRLRLTWPGENDRLFHVVNGDGDTIAQINCDAQVPEWQDRWSWFMSAFQYRNRPDFTGRSRTREDAMHAVKAAWPRYLEAMEDEGWMERVRRQKLGVKTVMFFDEAQYRAAPAAIEALAGCLEGTVEEARLSLLVDAVAHWEQRRGRNPAPVIRCGRAEGGIMLNIPIETELDAQRVTERIEVLAGCLEDTPEERELVDLFLAIEIWDTKRWKDACQAL